MTTISLVRHGHADWRPTETRPLSAVGQASAEALAEQFDHLPIAAIYSSPARRALQTIEPLAHRHRLRPIVLSDLRERELVAPTAEAFEAAIEATWREPERVSGNGESNLAAQVRGVAVVRRILNQHCGQHVFVATHGSLLALILNGFDKAFGYDFWRTLTFPDVYELLFRESTLVGARRACEEAA